VGDRIESFPIFPLPIVVVPREIAPLHIFEERYKTMVEECLDAGTGFGILWLGDDGLAEVGCTVRVRELLERMPDGRMNIAVEGMQPFRLLRRVEELAYPAGDIELLEDEQEADPARVRTARARYADVVEKATDERPADDDLVDMDAYGMAATIDLDPEFKQRLLESRSEPDRLDIVEELFEKAIQRLDQAGRAAESAQTNGKGRL
jgi:Lon protease-like protein